MVGRLLSPGHCWRSRPQAGVGGRLLSANSLQAIGSDHFGNGVGSADRHWRVGIAFRHIRNLSIRTPNDAVDFKGVAIEWTP